MKENVDLHNIVFWFLGQKSVRLGDQILKAATRNSTSDLAVINIGGQNAQWGTDVRAV